MNDAGYTFFNNMSLEICQNYNSLWNLVLSEQIKKPQKLWVSHTKFICGW